MTDCLIWTPEPEDEEGFGNFGGFDGKKKGASACIAIFPHCPRCGSYYLYRHPTGKYTCMTCDEAG